GGQRVTERRPAQHQATRQRTVGSGLAGGAELQPVGQVRPAAGDQLDRQVLARAGKGVLPDPLRQPGRVLHTGDADTHHAAPPPGGGARPPRRPSCAPARPRPPPPPPPPPPPRPPPAVPARPSS